MIHLSVIYFLKNVAFMQNSNNSINLCYLFHQKPTSRRHILGSKNFHVSAKMKSLEKLFKKKNCLYGQKITQLGVGWTYGYGSDFFFFCATINDRTFFFIVLKNMISFINWKTRVVCSKETMSQIHVRISSIQIYLWLVTTVLANLCAAQLASRRTWSIYQLEREIKTIRVSSTSWPNLLQLILLSFSDFTTYSASPSKIIWQRPKSLLKSTTW